MPESMRAFSKIALPRKYSSGESSDGLVMLTWTIRWTPACLAASKRVSVLLHGVGVLEQAVIEPHPVGVVEDRDALQVLGQEIRLVEMERERLDAVAKRIRLGTGSWSA